MITTSWDDYWDDLQDAGAPASAGGAGGGGGSGADPDAPASAGGAGGGGGSGADPFATMPVLEGLPSFIAEDIATLLLDLPLQGAGVSLVIFQE
jgi:hypothetical protein